MALIGSICKHESTLSPFPQLAGLLLGVAVDCFYKDHHLCGAIAVLLFGAQTILRFLGLPPVPQIFWSWYVGFFGLAVTTRALRLTCNTFQRGFEALLELVINELDQATVKKFLGNKVSEFSPTIVTVWIISSCVRVVHIVAFSDVSAFANESWFRYFLTLIVSCSSTLSGLLGFACVTFHLVRLIVLAIKWWVESSYTCVWNIDRNPFLNGYAEFMCTYSIAASQGLFLICNPSEQRNVVGVVLFGIFSQLVGVISGAMCSFMPFIASTSLIQLSVKEFVRSREFLPITVAVLLVFAPIAVSYATFGLATVSVGWMLFFTTLNANTSVQSLGSLVILLFAQFDARSDEYLYDVRMKIERLKLWAMAVAVVGSIGIFFFVLPPHQLLHAFFAEPSTWAAMTHYVVNLYLHGNGALKAYNEIADFETTIEDYAVASADELDDDNCQVCMKVMRYPNARRLPYCQHCVHARCLAELLERKIDICYCRESIILESETDGSED